MIAVRSAQPVAVPCASPAVQMLTLLSNGFVGTPHARPGTKLVPWLPVSVCLSVCLHASVCMLQVCIQGIPWKYTETELGELVAECGEVEKAEVMTSPDGRSKVRRGRQEAASSCCCSSAGQPADRGGLGRYRRVWTCGGGLNKSWADRPALCLGL